MRQKYNIFKELADKSSIIFNHILFIAAASFIFDSLGYAEGSPINNTYRTRSVSSVHYRRAGGVKFESRVDNPEFRSRSADRIALAERLHKYKKLSEEQAKKFSKPLPELPRCTRSQTVINKDQFQGLSDETNFEIDLLFYDPRDGQDRSAAEMWFGRVVPYEPEAPTSKTRLGHLLGLECLPTRIVTSKRGLELRTAEAAWKIKSKDADQRSKIFEKELKQVQNDLGK